MRVFVTGASGAIGTRLVPQLIDAGHEVIGTHNSPTSAELLRTLGAKPVMLDLLDARAVREAVREARPDAGQKGSRRARSGAGGTHLPGRRWERSSGPAGTPGTSPHGQGRPVFRKECFQSRKFAGAGSV